MDEKGALLLLHGITGKGEMIRQVGEYFCPSEWNLFTPDAPFKHPKRGFTWWEELETPESDLGFKRLYNKTIDTLEDIISGLPDTGPLIVGGFSQGGVMAQFCLITELSNRIKGLLLIGTCLPRNSLGLEVLSSKISNLSPIPVLWVHGEIDEVLTLKESKGIVKFFEKHGWPVTQIIHSRGHVIPQEFKENIRQWVDETTFFN